MNIFVIEIRFEKIKVCPCCDRVLFFFFHSWGVLNFLLKLEILKMTLWKGFFKNSKNYYFLKRKGGLRREKYSLSGEAFLLSHCVRIRADWPPRVRLILINANSPFGKQFFLNSKNSYSLKWRFALNRRRYPLSESVFSFLCILFGTGAACWEVTSPPPSSSDCCRRLGNSVSAW